jgi:hypothetical protein
MIAKRSSAINRYLQGRDTLMAPVMAELIRHQAIAFGIRQRTLYFLGFSKSVGPKTKDARRKILERR